MGEKTLEEMVEDMCCIIESIGTVKLKPGTPLHTLQQEMLRHVKSYRQSKENEIATCEHSGISFNRKGEVVEPEVEGHICMTKDLHGIDAL